MNFVTLQKKHEALHGKKEIVFLTGNTYPHRAEISKAGGEWSLARKAWRVPKEEAERLQKLIDNGV